ncbi:MAG: class I SAM-dependent methyltransferase [Chthoniobacterales bacterium]
MEDDVAEPEARSIEDENFDRVFPPKIRKLSALHWTPVRVATEAAQLLVTAPGTRVLDVGCGPAKFCLVAASLTEGSFTGVEQRGDLVAAARSAARRLQLDDVEIIHGNVLELDFNPYDAFYIYNPFEENMAKKHRIDATVPLSPFLFKRYNNHVAAQLGAMPLGTRVVTYAGYADEIPSCYDCESTFFRDELKLWIKRREYDPEIERLGLHTTRSYRGPIGWAPPRP